MPTFDRILVPVDLSPAPDAALQMACRIAEESNGSIQLLHVIRTDRVVGTPMESTWSGITGAVREEGEAILDRCLATMSDFAVPVDTEIREGTPTRNIVSCASEANCDLIIMATRGRLGMERLILGSVAEQVVRRSSVPVLTVKSETSPEHSSSPESLQNA